MEIEVHASRFSDEFGELVSSVIGIDVDLLRRHHLQILALDFLKQPLPASGDADLPTESGQLRHHRLADAGGGTDNDGFLVASVLHAHLL